jgi:O-methyltransferase domain
VLECARKRGFLDLALAARTAMQPCDFPPGTPWLSGLPHEKRAFRLNDRQAREILVDCRQAVPADGVPPAIGMGIIRRNLPSTGKLTGLVMLALTGGKARATEEYRGLLAKGGFQLNKGVPTQPNS